jgi:hypothetical protein
MKTINKLLAASVLAVSFAAPVLPAHAATDGLALTLAERDTYNNPPSAGWAYAMSAKHKMAAKHSAMDMNWPTGRTDTNVSPASMDSGLKQIK